MAGYAAVRWAALTRHRLHTAVNIPAVALAGLSERGFTTSSEWIVLFQTSQQTSLLIDWNKYC